MPSFTALLIHTCTIQAKTLSTSGYEQVASWSTLSANVPCRHDADGGVSIQDSEIRVNKDDDVFFFDKDVTISRGNRIVLDGNNYDVIKVKKMYDSAGLHHLEVVGRFVDTN